MELSGFKEAEFSETPLFLSESKCLKIRLAMAKPLDYQVYDVFRAKLIRQSMCKVDIEIQASQECDNAGNVNRYVRLLAEHDERLKIFLACFPLLEEKRVVYQYADEVDLNKANQQLALLKSSLNKYGIINDVIVRTLVETTPEPIVVNMKEKPAPVVLTRPNQNYRNRVKVDDYPRFKIADLSEGINEVKIQGEVFLIESRTTKKGTLAQRIYITDYEEAIVISRYESKRLSAEEMNAIKEGSWVSAFGDCVYNAYRRENEFNARRIDIVEHPGKSDTAPIKRVELHTHTKLSEMDGVSNIQDYIKQAAAWGHKALALTDHNVVQAYPAAQKCVKAINAGREGDDLFKMIYGVELGMVDPIYIPVTNPDNTILEDARYCVFDLEATGLSNKYDEIIEFGGIIIEDGIYKDSLQFFIKPTHPISAHITELTGITNDDVRDGVSIEEALNKIETFASGCVMVAHNAAYDIGMLNAALKRCGKAEITTPYIDTFHLAMYLLPGRRGYSLGAIARYYKIAYDGDAAHRADYDAKVLGDVLLNLLHELKGIKTLNDLAKCNHADTLTNFFDHHVVVLAKNDAGIKDIFELVTLCHTEYMCPDRMFKNIYVQRITREVLEKYRQKGNILIGSSCLNGEVFECAQTRSDEELAAKIKFYDYIEIQPPANYQHLVDEGIIASQEQLHQILRSIINAAHQDKVEVVASGDAHYVEEHKYLVRDIYINAQQIGGKHHPLYHNRKDVRLKVPSPKQHFRSTDEMLKAFDFLDEGLAYELVVLASNRIADAIDYIEPIKNKLYPPQIDGAREKLTKLCYDKAHSMYGETLPKIVAERLEKELNSIIGNGYEVVYYISHLLVKRSNDDGYLVGSRGSVGSSFVATMAGITEVNPLEPHYYCPECQYSEFEQPTQYQSGFDLPPKKCPHCGSLMVGDGQNIPFATFLGFEGDKIPDIDLNFSGEYQSKAHKYIQQVFGEENAFRAGTIGTVAEKTAFGYIKGYEEEMDCIGKLSESMRKYLTTQAAGVRRTTSQHPGGIVVFPRDKEVSDITPVQYPANDPHEDMRTTHLDYHEIEQNVLKFDILGHVDPTAMKMLEEISGIDVRSIPMNDPETMSIFSGVDALKIDTTRYSEKTGAAGLPEFGTNFVRGILEDTHPTTFEELLKISGLSHGTDVWLNNAKDLVDRKVVGLKDVIGCRDDIMVYLISKGVKPKLSFMIMESVRKGRGLKPDWIEAMKANGVEDWYIDSCLKIKYMFPKAHATAYVIMAMRIAWFKVHKPLHYYCQFFSIRCDACDIETMIHGEASIRQKMSEIQEKLNNPETKNQVSVKEKAIYNGLELALEMVLRGYRIGNIDLNRCQATRFSIDPDDPKTILPSFTSIDGLGENVALSIIEAREKAPFISKEDLATRTQLSKTLIDTLQRMHALDDLQDENQMSLFDF